MLLLLDVIPLSLGIETDGGVMSNLIGRCTTFPIEMRKIYSTPYDNCTNFDIDIYEGEEKFTKDNNLLGRFTLSDIEPAAKGVAQINVTFVIDADGILKVTAVDNADGEDKNITITFSRPGNQIIVIDPPSLKAFDDYLSSTAARLI